MWSSKIHFHGSVSWTITFKSWHKNFKTLFLIKVPGRSFVSVKIWNPLQIPKIAPPLLAWSLIDLITGEFEASNSPVIKSIRDHASRGGAILGICNGFQILTETKLLPGTLIRNNVLKFLCHDLNVIVQDTLPWKCILDDHI